MTTRTFNQLGIAFGQQPANITAKIGDVVVYQGPVTTLNESFPDLPNVEYQVTNQLFTWTEDIAFSGNIVLQIEVDQNAELLVSNIESNYTIQQYGNTVIPGSANAYVIMDAGQFGNTYVNNELQPPVIHGDLGGMWWWRIEPSGSFVENITIEPGSQ